MYGKRLQEKKDTITNRRELEAKERIILNKRRKKDKWRIGRVKTMKRRQIKKCMQREKIPDTQRKRKHIDNENTKHNNGRLRPQEGVCVEGRVSACAVNSPRR